MCRSLLYWMSVLSVALLLIEGRVPAQTVFNIPGDEVPQVESGQTVRFNRGSPLTPDWLPSGRFLAFPGSRVEIYDGGLVDQISAYGAEVEMSGGSAFGIHLADGSNFTMTGGAVFGSVGVGTDSRFTVSGGLKNGGWGAGAGSEIHVIGTEFSTHSFVPEISNDIQQLSLPGDSYVIERRSPLDDGAGGITPFVVEGTLMDGRSFDWELSEISEVVVTPDFSFVLGPVVNENATVRITLGFPAGFCDFDRSGKCDIADIDTLKAHIGSDDRHFDLNYDGLVDQQDVQQLLSNGFRGDANLDGAVDAQDLNIVGLNWQSSENVTFADGDFDSDGIVDASDLNDVGTKWLAPSVAAVPEPAGNSMLAMGLVLLLLQTRSSES